MKPIEFSAKSAAADLHTNASAGELNETVMAAFIEELRNVIRRLHNAEAIDVESVPVKETFRADTVWIGSVEADWRAMPLRTESTLARTAPMTLQILVVTQPCCTRIQSSQQRTL